MIHFAIEAALAVWLVTNMLTQRAALATQNATVAAIQTQVTALQVPKAA